MIDIRVRAIFALNINGTTDTDEINLMRYICNDLIKRFIDDYEEDLEDLDLLDSNTPYLDLSQYNIDNFPRKKFYTRGMLTFAGENSTSLGNLFGFFDAKRFFRIKKGIIDPKFHQELKKEDFEILPIGSIIDKTMILELEEPRSSDTSCCYIPGDNDKCYLIIKEDGQVKVKGKKWSLYGQFTPKGFNKFK